MTEIARLSPVFRPLLRDALAPPEPAAPQPGRRLPGGSPAARRRPRRGARGRRARDPGVPRAGGVARPPRGSRGLRAASPAGAASRARARPRAGPVRARRPRRAEPDDGRRWSAPASWATARSSCGPIGSCAPPAPSGPIRTDSSSPSAPRASSAALRWLAQEQLARFLRDDGEAIWTPAGLSPPGADAAYLESPAVPLETPGRQGKAGCTRGGGVQWPVDRARAPASGRAPGDPEPARAP